MFDVYDTDHPDYEIWTQGSPPTAVAGINPTTFNRQSPGPCPTTHLDIEMGEPGGASALVKKQQ